MQDMRLLIGALASHGVAPGVEFVAAVDSSQSRALVDQVVIGGAEAAVMVSGFDGLTTVLDTSPVTNNEVGVMVVGTGNATSSGGVRAFGGGMSSSVGQMV